MARAVLDQEHKERNGTRTEQYKKVPNGTEEYKTTNSFLGFGETYLAEEGWERPLDCIPENCVEVGVLHSGGSAGTSVGKFSLGECACICKATPLCVQFMSHVDGNCIMKSTFGPRGIDAAYIDGKLNC
ncbi:uncharacterized protein LOC111715630 [Eurytemora carolleeae]|uniref:uncharacterized protein LOC111715630 n=1 Tax=Eurytemora carolleeae TaxID=1294199 RepID=UPI000C7765B2|nr:uncharacterized protein LOC111715630 [Eurytemora carolleeae]|eukprot:XP_023346746.1 uncharacterized protein LOC111715630 [Eurytemora affinis]